MGLIIETPIHYSLNALIFLIQFSKKKFLQKDFYKVD